MNFKICYNFFLFSGPFSITNQRITFVLDTNRWLFTQFITKFLCWDIFSCFHWIKWFSFITVASVCNFLSIPVVVFVTSVSLLTCICMSPQTAQPSPSLPLSLHLASHWIPNRHSATFVSKWLNEQCIYTFNYRERNQKSGSCILGHFGYKEMYINIPESRVIKESKNNYTAMHENNVMWHSPKSL